MFRSILVFEHSPSVVLVALLCVMKGDSSPAKSRGLLLLLVGFASLLLMDRDGTLEDSHSKLASCSLAFNMCFHCFTCCSV